MGTPFLFLGVTMNGSVIKYIEAPLRLSAAGKVQEWAEQTNGFALPATRSVCTYATPTCFEGCYAKKGRMKFAIPQKAYKKNCEALLKAGSVEGMAELLIESLARVSFRVFRIHVSGDFFSVDYAGAWQATCNAFPTAMFWAYTRCRDPGILGVLRQTSNLRMLLSCDRDNWREMLAISEDFPCFGLSYYTMGEKPPEQVYARGDEVPVACPQGLVVFPDQTVRRRLSLPGTCPTDLAVNPWPKQQACVKCRRCCG